MNRFMCVLAVLSVVFIPAIWAAPPVKTTEVTVEGQLAKIMSAQQQILNELQVIKSELAIVKARATR